MPAGALRPLRGEAVDSGARVVRHKTTGGRGEAATARRMRSGYVIVSALVVRDVWPRLSFADTVIVKAFAVL